MGKMKTYVIAFFNIRLETGKTFNTVFFPPAIQ